MTDSKSVSDPPSRGGALDATARRRARYWGIGGLVLFLALTLILDFDRLRNQTFDYYQRFMPRAVTALPARLVEIDEASLRDLGPWPWPRTVLAALADAALRNGASAVAFDMLFPERDRHAPTAFLKQHQGLSTETATEVSRLPDPDNAFAALIGRAPIVLSRSGLHVAVDGGSSSAADLPIEAVFTGDRPRGLLTFPAAISNTVELDEIAAGHAAINGPPDRDGVIRRVPLLVDIAGNITSGMSLEILRVALGVEEIQLTAPHGELAKITLGPLSIPVAQDGRLRLHFSPSLASRAVSATDLLHGRVAAGTFDNSVVIISAAAVGLEDVVATPVTAESFGADVHAQTIENILSASWLQRPEWAERIELVIAVILALSAIIVMPFTAPRISSVILVGGGSAIGLASYLLFALGSMLFDPLIPMFGGAVGCLGTLGGQFLETEKARARLRMALVEERVQTAKLAGELAAAREIQLGMLPDQDALAALPDSIRVQAYLEPAKAVGGDLYDAFMLDDRWLYFIVGDVTGKGVPASLFMALAKALSKSVILRLGEDLEDAVMQANQEISRENTGELFVTALIGLLDTETGDVRMCNAGHDNPLILRASGGLEEIEMDGGPPLCVFEDFPYPEETCRLEPGDMMVVLTDGVTEAKSPDAELFGHTRVLEQFAPPPAGGQDLVDRLVNAVHSFEDGGDPTDDLTIMVLQYRG